MEIKKIEMLENGKLRQYDVLFTVEDEETGNEIIFYSDLDKEMDIFVGEYDQKTKTIKHISNPEKQKKCLDIYEMVKKEIENS